MKKWKKMNLQLFADGGDDGSGGGSEGTGDGGGSRGGSAGYTYEQLEEVASARANKAERVAIANYLRGKGMSEDDITTAIHDFKAKQKANQPDVQAIEKERDEALARASQLENEKLLTGKGVKADDLDYVAFKVNQLVSDDKDFKTAADEYLKANPRYTGAGQGYRVSTGVTGGNGSSGTESKNEQINNMIRNAAGR